MTTPPTSDPSFDAAPVPDAPDHDLRELRRRLDRLHDVDEHDIVGLVADLETAYEELVTADEEDVPVVSVIDGHSHALAFIGSALGVPQQALGVDDFGQSGTRADLYRHYGIDAPALVTAARTLLGV